VKYKYIFLLGRPACGKSAVYRALEERILFSGQALSCERMDDFPKLMAKFQRDDALEREGQARIHSTRTDDGGYFPKGDVFNQILKEVNADVLSVDRPDHVIFIEFARPSYTEALQNFDRRILDNCLAVYIDVSFDLCWERNVARHTTAIAEGQEPDPWAEGGDDHMIHREAMEKLYLQDDQEPFVQHMKDQNIPVAVVNNEAQGEEHLNQQVQELFQTLF
jgi:adenylate kinase family enzyme